MKRALEDATLQARKKAKPGLVITDKKIQEAMEAPIIAPSRIKSPNTQVYEQRSGRVATRAV